MLRGSSIMKGELDRETILRNSEKKNIKINFLMPRSHLDSIAHIPFKPGWNGGFRPIQIKVFNNNNLIFHYSSCEGRLNASSRASNLPSPDTLYGFDTSMTLSKDLSYLIPVDTQNINFRNNQIVEVYIATYTGILGRMYVKKARKLAKKLDYDLIIVNTDLLKEDN